MKDNDVIKLEDIQERIEFNEQAFGEAHEERRWGEISLDYKDLVGFFTGQTFLGRLTHLKRDQRTIRIKPGGYQIYAGRTTADWVHMRMLVVSPLLDPVKEGAQPPVLAVEYQRAAGALLVLQSEDLDEDGVPNERDRWKLKKGIGDTALEIWFNSAADAEVMPLNRQEAVQLMRDIVAVL